MTKRIVSAVPGRLRVKDPLLSDRATVREVIDSASRELPVLETHANPAACSVVIRYDARAIPLPEMQKRTEDVLAACLASRSEKSPPRRYRYRWRRSPRLRLNRYAKIGAMASLAASLGFAYTGRKRPHIVAGWVFVACLCAHMAVFRRTLAR
ncbi:MAG: hypothetical protein LBQ62_02715 [Candidatus Accumulibacter sp.]|jgi:hypothetical protein|nr:hypothetical protein [Accumulibacter sp.]